MIQAISAHHMTEQETNSELDSDQEQLHMAFSLNIESDSE